MSDTISSVEETVVHGDIVTKVTQTKTMNADHSVTTTTTVDETDHADEDNHTTTLSKSTTASPDIEQKIIRQIEHYFSDTNIIQDKFLKNEIIKNDGWISLSLLTTFKRLQSLTTDFKIIMNSLKKSLSGLLQLNEIENKIRRHPDRSLPNNRAELELSLRNRTVYIKGFPTTDDITLDKLIQFFDKYGSIENIKMKKDFKTKNFNGSVFIIFPTKEAAQEFIENTEQMPIKYDDQTILECSLQDNYYKNKTKKIIINEKEKQKKMNQHLEKLNNKNLPGALIHLSGLPSNATRELIKEKFNSFTKTPWINFNKGDTEAWVRLNEPNTAKDVLQKVLAAENGKLMIGDNEITNRIVENEEEIQFWKETNEKRAAQRTQQNERYTGKKRCRNGKQEHYIEQKHKDDESNNNEDESLTELKSPKKLKGLCSD